MAPTDVKKMIVVGEPNGKLKEVFAKLSQKYQKTKFNFAIITGNLFDQDDAEVEELLAGKIIVPFQTYFTVGTNPMPARVVEKLAQDFTLCQNLTYLGKRSIIETPDKTKIVTLGGTLDWSIKGGQTPEDFLPVHSSGDAKSLKGAQSADILLTSQWPSMIRSGSYKAIAEGAVDPQGDENIAELCAAIKPRYHFSTSNMWFKREPFYHPLAEGSKVKQYTQFFSLAPFAMDDGKALQHQAMFAQQFSKDPPATAPLGRYTYSPFSSLNRKRKQNFDSASYSRSGPHNAKRPRAADDEPPKECYFCPGRPEDRFEDHLVVQMDGDVTYMALPKGPLTTSTAYSSVGVTFPTHVLICPSDHAKTVATLVNLVTSQNVGDQAYKEMTESRKLLQDKVSTASNGALGSVTYEISMGRNIHVNWQFLAVDRKYTAVQPASGKSLAEAAFQIGAQNLSHPSSFRVRNFDVGRGEAEFVRIWIWTPSTEDPKQGVEQCFVMPIRDSFALEPNEIFQFGRNVLAKLLGLEARADWKILVQSREEEEADAAALKEVL